MFSTFLCFWLVILLFTMAPKHSADVLSSVAEYKTAEGCLMEKIHVIDKFVQTGVTVLLTVSSMLMNPQYILNKVSLNRNTHKTRLCIDWLIRML